MRARRKRQRLLPTVWLDWSPAIARLFALVPADWEPPHQVRIRGGLQHATVSARFRTPGGFPSTARVRIGAADLAGSRLISGGHC